ncbi:hypothetical protein COT07_04035 [Candidatus Woesearchaeota archaeon CG07_land_8_20_14_0_80_44_23]|jgi:MFS family permease|nr:MAG: hypothetical protein COT07_04035 [Candidatus Woesearchaeota archaeon CG07_land_8_20_14_0_80_44_23]
MNEELIYPAILIISGILISTIVIIFLTRFSNKITKFFELYPESRGILSISLKIICWFIGLIIFLIFFRWALIILNQEFTKNFVENIITASPKYILAVVIIISGSYISRWIRERSKDYHFEFKERMLLIMDLIIYMTFVFTALYSVGINMIFFLEFYKVLLWIIGAIIALIISMTIGIPLGISIYERMKKEKKKVSDRQKKEKKVHDSEEW